MSWDAFLEWFSLAESKVILTIIKVVLPAAIGLPLIYVVAMIFSRGVKKRFSEQSAMIVRKAIGYTGVIIVLVITLNQMGFKLTALLGAAGIAGIAIGFAAQTSVSNIISGFFLISEKPFAVGDVIDVGGTKGTVLSIDLMSVKIKSFDNRFIRIPNESIIKSEVVNITRFPIRRHDMTIGVAYKEDIGRVTAVLKDLLARNPYVLDEPEPLVIFTNLGDSALEFFVGVWFAKEDFLKLRSTLLKEIKDRFDSEGIEIPFPHRTLYTGAVTDPFPIKLVGDRLPGSPTEGEPAAGA